MPIEVVSSDPQRPNVRRHPADMSPEERAQWLYDTINSTISLPQWQAWANKVDPKCPPEAPFRTDKRVSGGDQNECVETPDNCPYGTTAFGKDQCIGTNDPRIAASSGVAPGGEQAAQGLAAPARPGIQDLLTNMTFQRMFGSLNPKQLGETPTAGLFNIGGGRQARTLEGGALMWGGINDQGAAPPPAALPAPGAVARPPVTGGPAGVGDRGLFGVVNGMARRRPRPQAPRTAPQTFTY